MFGKMYRVLGEFAVISRAYHCVKDGASGQQ